MFFFCGAELVLVPEIRRGGKGGTKLIPLTVRGSHATRKKPRVKIRGTGDTSVADELGLAGFCTGLTPRDDMTPL
jgi:hypothetical protein